MKNTVEATIAGTRRELCLTQRALYKLEKHTGKPVTETLDALTAGSYSAFVDVIWAARLHAEPRLKPEAVADEIPFSDLARVAEELVGLFESMAPAVEEEDDEGNG